MRHRRAGYRLGRTSSHRASTLRNLAIGLFQHGQIVTTLQRAKAVQPMVERMITTVKHAMDKADAATDPKARAAAMLHARRLLEARLGGDKRAFDWLYTPKKPTEQETALVTELRERAEQFFPVPASSEVERNRYGEVRQSPRLTHHIIENVAPKFRDRAGGYTRIIKLGKHRLGDGGELVLLQFCGAEEGPEISGQGSTRRKIGAKRKAFAEQRLAAVKASAPAA
jgi:large subunit ribosomal protein L17